MFSNAIRHFTNNPRTRTAELEHMEKGKRAQKCKLLRRLVEMAE